MQLCSNRMPKAAKNRSRRGQKIRNGRISSTKNVPPVATLNTPGGTFAAYHASGVGSGCVKKGYDSADRVHQIGSPLASLTTPDMNMNRNSNQRDSQMPGIVAMLNRSATNPASSRNVSHWKLMKVCPA